MAQIPNTKALTEGDGLNDYFNINTSAQRLELPNGMTLVQYADNYSTTGLQLAGGNVAPLQSATAAATGAAGTIATANVGIARISPAAARTGVVLQAGTIPGQQVLVINEAVLANSVTFDVSGTSNVADGKQDIIPGLSARLYVWDSVQSLWFPTGSYTVGGSVGTSQSAAAAATGNAGTIATAGVVAARVSPAAAVTAVILQAGTYPGQLCVVVNEAVLANSVTFDVSGTSNVADGIQDVIPGLSAKLFVWDSVTALWYPTGSLTLSDAYGSVQSATAVATLANGTIATAGLSISRVSPAAARTGIILQPGTYPGQQVTIVNEAVAGNTLTLNTTPATANVADSATEAAIPGLTARSYVWDSATALWYRCN